MMTFSVTGSYTDLYELTMAEAYFSKGRQMETACFDYLFRKVPNSGGYVVYAGLGDVLEVLKDFHFTAEDISFLRNLNFSPGFLDYLKGFQFRGDVYSCLEGEIVFPNCPILRIEGNIIETQIVETVVLNLLNFESLVATKAARMKQVSQGRSLSDFGLRRAHGMGGIAATRAAIVGGFESTSNVYAAEVYGLPAVGTMAHSFIESYENELDAFRAFVDTRPNDCIFLVDTYDTLKSGIPNAITVAREMEDKGLRAKGIRLDSGDLAYLSKEARRMLDEAGLNYIKIVASNQLDEYVIRSLLEQDAPIDIFGVGTRLVTGQPDAALDGVYKLSMASGAPRLKLSETLQKTTLPGIKQVLRIFDDHNLFYGADAIVLEDEGLHAQRMFHPFEPEKSLDLNEFQQEPLLQPVMSAGQILSTMTSLQQIAEYSGRRLGQLPDEYKRLENPHRYKVGISEKLMNLRNSLRHKYKSI